MPRWLQEMLAPTLMLWLCVMAMTVTSALSPAGVPKRAELASSVAFPLVVAAWVLADARKRHRRLCHDFDSFIYFAWPIVVPVYLFQTRGVRAFLTLLCFAGIWVMASLIGGVIAFVQGSQPGSILALDE